ncbi:hypothetical protein K3759_12480 [Sulfitobacter sp. W027]|jgi:hypothetical protein|uniref:hypothetical protein n=1 Tax=Sulfitobacter sp. W027 TaxID=2867025 RepID=UPI0021A458FD|nr:hypothetical protein [Sulfitobacter sp. W027]UWR32756.1 hypothetical protein K3759_12480 [Sulfitobacter sp. W027]
MQMICHFDVTDFASWKQAFDADAEARRDAGLSVLQIWQHADSSSKASVLLNVNDRKRADDWLSRSNALSSDDKGTVTSSTAYFVKPA